MFHLNERAARLTDSLVDEADLLGLEVAADGSGARLIDCSGGGLEAGRRLAEICLAGLGEVAFTATDSELWEGPSVMVRTDHPVAACMASQYAGWQLSHEKFFAMGSGPMRAAAGKEELFDAIGLTEQPPVAVGVLETGQTPPTEVCRKIAADTGVPPENLTLLCAPTASQPGTVQVVARSVETALHKLFELGFDLSRVASGFGTAPLPPVAGDDLAGIGRTNDAVLYGGTVTLWVRGDDAVLQDIGHRVPSSASRDHGEPFARIFKRYGGDFYKIDPHLFSPALIRLNNLDTGRTHLFGHLEPDVIARSFST